MLHALCMQINSKRSVIKFIKIFYYDWSNLIEITNYYMTYADKSSSADINHRFHSNLTLSALYVITNRIFRLY